MKASEIITVLAKLIAEVGDVDVVLASEGEGATDLELEFRIEPISYADDYGRDAAYSVIALFPSDIWDRLGPFEQPTLRLVKEKEE